MRRSVVFLCSLSATAYGAFEDLKKEIFTAENTGRWKGQADMHVPMLHLDPVKGGGWDAMIWTTHGKQPDNYIGKHWVEDGDGHVVFQDELSLEDTPLNRDQNQTSMFKVPKGTKDPLTTYAWCNMHGTWAHTWTGVQLSHSEEDVRFDEHGNEITEEYDVPDVPGVNYKKPHEVPVHAKVSAEDLKEFKTNVYTAEAPGQWKGKASLHVPDLEMHPVSGGGWIAELETTHGKDAADFISKHWIEDGKGRVLGVVDFDIKDDGEHNRAKKQASKFHVPKDAAEPLTTYAYCNLHGTWAHTWSTLSLAHFSDQDEL